MAAMGVATAVDAGTGMGMGMGVGVEMGMVVVVAMGMVAAIKKLGLSRPHCRLRSWSRLHSSLRSLSLTLSLSDLGASCSAPLARAQTSAWAQESGRVAPCASWLPWMDEGSGW